MIENRTHITKRIFIGAFIRDKQTLQSFSKIKQEFSPLMKAKWTKPENLHITAYFYGNAQLKTIEKIKEALNDILQQPIKSKIELKGLGIFYKKHKPYILYMNPKNKEEILQTTIRAIQLRLLENDLIKEIPSNYTPHITLARIKKANTEFEQIVKQYEHTVFGTINELTFEIIESILTPQGPIYKTLQL